MNRDSQEKRIRRLFHELGREDERNAPGFASVVQTALLLRMAHRRPRRWRLAPAIGLPVLAIVLALLLLVRNSTEPAPPGDFTTLQTFPLPPERPLLPEVSAPQYMPTLPIHIGAPRRRTPALPTRNSSILISQWQSPTDFLLKVPGNELLKSLPRIPDSHPGITRSLIENHN